MKSSSFETYCQWAIVSSLQANNLSKHHMTSLPTFVSYSVAGMALAYIVATVLVLSLFEDGIDLLEPLPASPPLNTTSPDTPTSPFTLAILLAKVGGRRNPMAAEDSILFCHLHSLHLPQIVTQECLISALSALRNSSPAGSTGPRTPVRIHCRRMHT